MGSMVSGLVDAVLGVVQGAGLSSDTVARYGKCCEAVVEFCGRRGFDALPGSAARRVRRVPAGACAARVRSAGTGETPW
jgi:hypothetical protein